jgi:nitrite reductase/ring-hydroxylating ferredoxin subunit
LAQFETGRTVRIDVDGTALLVHRTDDGVRVYDAHCPHQATLLSQDAVTGTRLVCHKHGWEFDVLDGRVIKGNAPLRQLPHRIDDNVVSAYW